MENNLVLVEKIKQFLGEKPIESGNSLWKIFHDKNKRIKIVLTIFRGNFHIYLHLRPFNLYKNMGRIVLDENLNEIEVSPTKNSTQVYFLSKLFRSKKLVQIPKDFLRIDYDFKKANPKNKFSLGLDGIGHRESDILINNLLEHIEFETVEEARNFVENLNTSRSFVSIDKVAKKPIEYPSKLKVILLRTSEKRKSYIHQCVQKLPESFIIEGRKFNILGKLNIPKELKSIFSSNEEVNLDLMLFNTLIFKINYRNYFLRVTIKCEHEEGKPYVKELFVFEVVNHEGLDSAQAKVVIAGYAIHKKTDVNGKVTIDY